MTFDQQTTDNRQLTTIVSLRLQNVRLYTDETFEFEPGVNIIVGPNASGKTTLIEALTVVACGGSYKSRDMEIVRHGEEWARVDAGLGNVVRTVKLKVTGDVLQKSYEIDGKTYQRLPHQQTIPYVLFEPNQLQLLTTQPDLRRTLIDDLIEQTKPSFASVRKQYKRVLRQRNALLKQSRSKAEDYFVWNLRLSEFAGVIVRERQMILSELNSRLGALYSDVAGKQHDVSFVYQPLCAIEQYETDLLRQLEARLAIDKERGYTTRGPHRDDITIMLNNHPIGGTASRGETRTLLLALKIAEAEIIERERNMRPILLFDDVFGELDGKRRHYLTNLLKTYQTFITTTDADIALEYFTTSTKLLALG